MIKKIITAILLLSVTVFATYQNPTISLVVSPSDGGGGINIKAYSLQVVTFTYTINDPDAGSGSPLLNNCAKLECDWLKPAAFSANCEVNFKAQTYTCDENGDETIDAVVFHVYGDSTINTPSNHVGRVTDDDFAESGGSSPNKYSEIGCNVEILSTYPIARGMNRTMNGGM